MSDIEIRLFRYFVAVAEERHFAHAALRLKITPPTLTHQIKKLESQLGIKLFVRKGNTLVTLTEAGQRFLGSAREALRQVEEAATIARQAERGEVGHIDLGFMTSVSCGGLLRTWIGEFQRANPAIDIAMRQLVPMTQIAAMIRKELDAGFTRPPHKYPRGVQGFEIYCEPLVLALPSQHPLTRHTNVAPAMLPDEAFVNTTAEREVGFLNDTEIIAKIGNFTPRVVRRDDSLITVLTYVANGYGIAIVPQLMRTINISNVVFRDIAASPVPNTSIAFVYRDDPSPSVKLLIKHMQRHALDNDRAKVPPRTNVVSLKDRK